MYKVPHSPDGKKLLQDEHNGSKVAEYQKRHRWRFVSSWLADKANKSSHRGAANNMAAAKRQNAEETRNAKSRMQKITWSVQKVNAIDAEEEIQAVQQNASPKSTCLTT